MEACTTASALTVACFRTSLFCQTLEFPKRRGTNVMLYPFSVDFCRFLIDADAGQKLKHDLVTLAATRRELAALHR